MLGGQVSVRENTMRRVNEMFHILSLLINQLHAGGLTSNWPMPSHAFSKGYLSFTYASQKGAGTFSKLPSLTKVTPFIKGEIGLTGLGIKSVSRIGIFAPGRGEGGLKH